MKLYEIVQSVFWCLYAFLFKPQQSTCQVSKIQIYAVFGSEPWEPPWLGCQLMSATFFQMLLFCAGIYVCSANVIAGTPSNHISMQNPSNLSLMQGFLQAFQPIALLVYTLQEVRVVGGFNVRGARRWCKCACSVLLAAHLE